MIGLPFESRNPPIELASHQAETLPIEVGDRVPDVVLEGEGEVRSALQSATRPPPTFIAAFGPIKATFIHVTVNGVA
jgi:hypothetical protein